MGILWYNPGMNTDVSLNQINQSFETRAAEARAQDLGLPFVDLLNYPINPDVLKLVPVANSEASQTVLFHKNGKTLRLGVVNPETEETNFMVLALQQQGFQVETWMCSKSGFEKVFSFYGSDLVYRKEVEVRHDFEEDTGLTFENQFKGFENLLKTLELVPVTQALNEIEIAAIQGRASDIHLQPYEDHGDLRLRIDGILHSVGRLSAEKAQKIVMQIKYEAGMRANVSDVPQDGHITFVANQRKIDLRVSSLPTEFGESIVMRVLDSGRGIKSFVELGFDGLKEQKMLEVLKKKNGLVLVTGPTGSGKTTTLYAMLKQLNDPERKLVTLEDPIEYHLDDITQSQVSDQGNYDFSNGLRALLRHDPDVMLIGEIRDLSTAKLAAEASLTGHVVLSSLHTNSAIGAVTRLRNLGLESFNIASSLNAIFAQRLVRRVCPDCGERQSLELSEKVLDAMERVKIAYPEIPAQGGEPMIASEEGCETCSHTGYVGQTVIAEVVFLDHNLRAKVSANDTEMELDRWIKDNDQTFLTLFEDGIRKVMLGETTVEEVYRVAG